MKSSWRTTSLGIIAALVVVGNALLMTFDEDPNTNANWPEVAGVCAAAFGLLLARDNKVTSEQAGAK